ncbi:MAG: DUF4380 domain-containing protein [Verrucomicrobiota bacterium]
MRSPPHPAALASLLLTALALLPSAPISAAPAPASGSSKAVTTATIAYHGWSDALQLRNAQVEVVVVPAIGRVMSFRFLDGENVFWDDRSLDGKRGDSTGKEWVNFGGDKTWPAPEAEWKNYTGQTKWMPPAAFDSLPVTGRFHGSAIVLTSPVDPHYGVRTHRRIALATDAATLTIETTYERVSGTPAKIGIWVITQFTEPVAVYVPIPARSQFPTGYFAFRDNPWPQLTARDGLIRLTRDPKDNHKLGSDADRMLWVGEKALCLVSTPRIAGADYADRGATAEVYTNPDPKKYVELETLGPLATLKPGGRISQTNTYVLFRHAAGSDPETEARRILAVK